MYLHFVIRKDKKLEYAWILFDHTGIQLKIAIMFYSKWKCQNPKIYLSEKTFILKKNL